MDDLKLAIDSNFALKSTKDWFLREAPYDVIIQVDGVSFPLHKAPLVSRSGLMRRLVMEDEDCSQLELMRLPGGAHGFELAAKFCYGVKLEVHAANVALLRCVAERLEMTEDYGVDNLVLDAEAYLEDILRKDFTTVVRVLHSCDKLLPLAEQLHVVARSVDAAASLLVNFRAAPSSTRSSIDSSSCFGGESSASIDFDTSARSSRSSNDFNPNNSSNGNNKGLLWWMDDLSTLSLGLFETMIKALVSKGLPSQTISRALLHYAHKCFEGLAKEQAMTWHTNFRSNHHHHQARSSTHENVPQQQQHHESKVLETIVRLLPSGEKNAVPLNLLLELLRIALLLHLPVTCNCRVNLERRIASRLHHATLDDLLIPSFSKEHGENGGGSGDGTTYDVEATRRLLVAFLQLHADGDFSSSSDNEDEDEVDRNREGDGKVKRMTRISMTKVAYLVDSYLAEVAPDSHLSATEFTAVADLLPEHARSLDDGIYRAVDIYLKAHPTLTDEERKKLCKVVDFHKLSHDACVHAAQNERLPLPTVVQVLYLEQMKIRDEISVDHVPITPPNSHPSPLIVPNPTANHHLALVPTSNSESLHETSHNTNHHLHNSTNSVGALIVHPAVSCTSSSNSGDHYASVRRENMELKLEVARMRMRLCDIEKEHTNMKHDIEKTYTDHEHHSSQHSDHLNDHHTSSQVHTASEHHTPQHSSHHPPPAASTGGSNSSSNHGHHHQHHNGGFFHAVSKTLSKLNVFHHPKHHSHHHEEHDRTEERADHADHTHHNNHHNHHSSHHKSPSNHHHHHHHHSSHHKSPSHHHHSSSHHRSPSHHSSSHHRSPSHHSNHHRSPSHHSSHHRSPSHHSSHHKSPSHHHHRHHSSHHKSPSHHSHHSSHHKSPSHHSHHHSSHHKSPSHHHHHHHSSHHRRDSATPSPEHHSSNSRHHASPSPADHHSSCSRHKSPNNRSRHSSSSSERHQETNRDRHYSPSPDHRSHHSSHSRHRSSEHDGHHHHRSHHHHNRDHHGHGHSHHGHRRHHSPSSNSSTSPVQERDHHSRNSSPDRRHHHSLHRSPSPDYHHHRSHHKSHEHHHRNSRSPTSHHQSHGHHSTAQHRSSSRDHHHRSQHHHSRNHHSDNDHHTQEGDHHGHHGHHQGHHTPDPSHVHEALNAAGNQQHEAQHSDHHHHHHGHHKDNQSQEGRKW